MDRFTLEALPYSIDSAPLFSRLLDLEQPVFLDSAAPYSNQGRFDIFSAEPLKSLKYTADKQLKSEGYKPNLNCFDDAREQLAERLPDALPDSVARLTLPFKGGIIGFFGYDAARTGQAESGLASRDLQLPDAALGIYSWAVVVDHQQRCSTLLAHPQTPKPLLREIRQRLTASGDSDLKPISPFTLTGEFQSNFSRRQYDQAFAQIQAYILAGDCYQVNLAQRLSAHYQGSPWHAYQTLRKTAAAPFSAYMQVGDSHILSVSPERFLQLKAGQVHTSPIKGTIARGTNPREDQQLAQQLLHSTKDRAENLMIVDLLRNDLGRCCQYGSISVEALFELQSFETVHHLVSTINGRLKPDHDALQLLASCFPGGSITGAPKIRAMQIIDQLEPHRRSAYCGSVGYISCDGAMDTNIAIRTMVCEQGDIHCWAGGGIVADSDCDSEHQECLTKVDKLLAALANPAA